jgi:hypothetical protein
MKKRLMISEVIASLYDGLTIEQLADICKEVLQSKNWSNARIRVDWISDNSDVYNIIGDRPETEIEMSKRVRQAEKERKALAAYKQKQKVSQALQERAEYERLKKKYETNKDKRSKN